MDLEIGQKGKTYGLLLPKKSQNKVQVSSVFGDDSDDESPHASINSSIQKSSQQTKIKRQTQLEIDKALEADPTVYEYDSIYDSMQEKKAKQVQELSSGKSKAEKKAKYIAGLLKSSEVRKREYERQQERKVQKEREKEGNEFADKEVFVTGAYRKKMQEMQEAEEEERRQAQLEAMLDVKKQKDMSGFYRYMLNERTGENIQTNNDKVDIKKETTEKQNENGENEGAGFEKVEEKVTEKAEQRSRKQYRRRRSSSASSDQLTDNRKRSSSSSDKSKHPSKQRKRSSSSHKEPKEHPKQKKMTHSSDEDHTLKDKKKTKSSGETRKNSNGQKQSSGESSSSDEEDNSKTTTVPLSNNNKLFDKELTIEEIKLRYAQRTTPKMIEEARERYFLRKIERFQYKQYIFRSDE